MPLLTFEPGNTVQFTWVASVTPDGTPNFSVKDRDGTLVASFSAVQSDTTHYYALYTMPESGDQWFSGIWTAQRTAASSVRPFVQRFGFRVLETVAEN